MSNNSGAIQNDCANKKHKHGTFYATQHAFLVGPSDEMVTSRCVGLLRMTSRHSVVEHDAIK